jgi:hypothetical protein
MLGLPLLKYPAGFEGFFFPELLVCSPILLFVTGPLASRGTLLESSDCPPDLNLA